MLGGRLISSVLHSKLQLQSSMIILMYCIGIGCRHFFLSRDHCHFRCSMPPSKKRIRFIDESEFIFVCLFLNGIVDLSPGIDRRHIIVPPHKISSTVTLNIIDMLSLLPSSLTLEGRSWWCGQRHSWFEEEEESKNYDFIGPQVAAPATWLGLAAVCDAPWCWCWCFCF